MIWCGKKAYRAIFPSRVSGISKLQDKGSFGVVVIQSLLIALKNKGMCKITFWNFTQIPWQPSGERQDWCWTVFMHDCSSHSFP